MTLETINEKKVKNKFGELKYKTIIQYCENDTLKLDDLLQIAERIDPRLYGQVYRNRDKDFRLLCRHMFHFWWKIDGGNGVQLQKLIQILKDEDVKQDELAQKLEEKSTAMAVPIEAPGPDPEIQQVQTGPEIPYVQASPEIPQTQVDEGNEVSMILENAFKKLGKPFEFVVNEGARKALLIGNTYKRASDRRERLAGCEESVIEIKKALGTNLLDKGKTPFDCSTETNLSVDQIRENVKDICKEANDELAAALLVYFTGHGGHEPLELKSNDDVELASSFPDGMKYLLNAKNASVSEGGNFIWGEKNGELAEKMYKYELIAQICEDTKNVGHRIIIFDCCRGDQREERKSMSATTVATLKVKFSKLNELSNKDYKNTFVFHSTLPHQVAWCEDLMTTFSKFFAEFVGGNGGVVDINCLDIAINQAIKMDMLEGSQPDPHIQMIELTKFGVNQPFVW